MQGSQPSFTDLLEEVKNGHRKAQKVLYETYYSYAKNICLQYSQSEQEAVEILNDGFLSIFKHIELYDDAYSFRTWMRKIMVNKSIDYFRKYHKLKTVELDTQEPVFFTEEDMHELDRMEDLLPYIQKLSPMYRMVLNLHVLEDCSHEEISKKLNISPVTSRSNLFRAIENLKKLIIQSDKVLIKK